MAGTPGSGLRAAVSRADARSAASVKCYKVTLTLQHNKQIGQDMHTRIKAVAVAAVITLVVPLVGPAARAAETAYLDSSTSWATAYFSAYDDLEVDNYGRWRLHGLIGVRDSQVGDHQWGTIATVNLFNNKGEVVGWEPCTAYRTPEGPANYSFCSVLLDGTSSPPPAKMTLDICTWDSTGPALAHWCDPSAHRIWWWDAS